MRKHGYEIALYPLPKVGGFTAVGIKKMAKFTNQQTNTKHAPIIRLNDKSLPELLALFMIEIANDSEYYDELAFCLLKEYSQWTLEHFNSFSSPRQCAIIRTLSWADKHIDFDGLGIDRQAFLLPLLDSSDDWVIFATIGSLSGIGCPHLDKITPFLHHANPHVRSASMIYFAKRLGVAYKDALIAYLADPHPLIRETALDELDEMDELGDDELIKIVSHCLNDDDTTVKDLAAYIINSRR